MFLVNRYPSLATDRVSSAGRTPFWRHQHEPQAHNRRIDRRHPSLDIVCSLTPELDEMLALMRSTMGAEDAQQRSYLSAGIEPGTVASFFEAAAELFRARPWKIVPDDQCVIEVTVAPARPAKGKKKSKR